MSQSNYIARPAGGEVQTVAFDADNASNLSFELAETSASPAGTDPAFAFEQGDSLALNNSFVMGDETLSDIALPGDVRIAGNDPDLSTAPALGTQENSSSGAGAYADYSGELLSGVDKLDALGTNRWADKQEAAPAHISAAADEIAALADTQLVPQPEPEIPFDERFVVTRNSASLTLGHVLHNDGVDDSAAIVGVQDAQGVFHSLEDLAAMNGGLGLETEFGWVRVAGSTVVYEAKDTANASSVEVIVYVAEISDGSRYTQNVQIRFSDDANNFSSDEAVDTYYSRDTSAGEMANISLGAGKDRIIIDGKHADGTDKTIHAGDGDNYIELNSGATASVDSGSLSVGAGSGADTISLSSHYDMANNSTLSINAGEGVNSVSMSAADGHIAAAGSTAMVSSGGDNDIVSIAAGGAIANNSTLGIETGAGNDSVHLETAQGVAQNGSTVTVDMGEGDNTITSFATNGQIAKGDSTFTVKAGSGQDSIDLTSRFYFAENGGTVAVDAGDGDNSVTLKGHTLAYDGSRVGVEAGSGSDTISITSEHGAVVGSRVSVDSGDGDDRIMLNTTNSMADNSSTLTVNAGAGNDAILMNAGGNIANSGSTVNVEAGSGDTSLSIHSGQNISIGTGSEVNIETGNGADVINLTAQYGIAEQHGVVTIDTGEGDDLVNIAPNGRIASSDATLSIHTGDGEDTVNLSTTGNNYLSADRAMVHVDGGDGNDEINIRGGELFTNSGKALIEGGDGNDAITVDMQKVNGGTLFLDGGDGDDLIAILGGDMSNEYWGSNRGDDGVVLTGGAGADTFAFGGSDTNALSGTAIIADFNYKEGDKLLFSDLFDDSGSLEDCFSVSVDEASSSVTLNVDTGNESFSVRLDGVLGTGGCFGDLSGNADAADAIKQLLIANDIILQSS